MKETSKLGNGGEESNLSSFSLRGRVFVGTVISSKMQKTVTVEWERKHYLKKYERYEKRRSRVKAHNPDSMNAQEGDIVKIMECRPLSKTKNFVVIQVLGKEKGFQEKVEARQESKAKKEKEEAETEKESEKGAAV